MSVPTNLIGKRVGNNRIELVSLLGEGSYGAVYRGILHRGGLRSSKHCAVKVQRNTTDERQRLCLRRELELHERVSNNDGVVTLYETFKEGAYVFIIMKFCRDGDLWTGINNGRFLGNDFLIKNIFTQILDAVEYCHSRSVYHRDIKPENILLCEGGYRALLADFGLATGESLSKEMRSGSPWYMSPECWGKPPNTREEPYLTAPNDVWSLGVLLINLACGRQAPWRCAHRMDRFFNDFLKQPDLLRLFVPLSPQVHDILARIFVPDPTARISIEELKIAIKDVKSFVVPSSRRREYHEYQRAVWKATVGPSVSRPFSIITANVGPPSSESATQGHDTVRQISLAPWNQDSLDILPDHDITIVANAQPVEPMCSRPLPALPSSSSSGSSVDSDGPVTPDMPAVISDIEIPDIDELLKGEVQGLQQSVVLPVLLPQKNKMDQIRYESSDLPSWQGILDAIKAL